MSAPHAIQNVINVALQIYASTPIKQLVSKNSQEYANNAEDIGAGNH